MKKTIGKFRKIIPIVFLVMFSASCFAEFLDTKAIDVRMALTSFPADDSEQGQQDYRTLQDFQKTRTDAECKRAASEVPVNIDSFYGPAYGPLTKVEVGQLASFFTRVHAEAKKVTQPAKDFWHRDRPFVAHKDLKPCVEKEQTYSYPSGHATSAELFARILLDIFPDRVKAIKKREDQIVDDRAIAGVHYPTDLRAGKLLGDLIYDEMQKNSTYKAELKKLTTALGVAATNK